VDFRLGLGMIKHVGFVRLTACCFRQYKRGDGETPTLGIPSKSPFEKSGNYWGGGIGTNFKL